jgi:broad specificity phosphatase PhoE
MPLPPGTILLARHGETDDNREPLRVQGSRDTPLNATGRAQAQELAARLENEGVVSLWTSQLSRARETAEIAGARLGLEPRVDARLAEGNRGEWEGRLFADVEASDPAAWAAWQAGGAGWRFPGGESLQEHADRVASALADVRASGELPAAVVCHGGSIRTVLCAADPRGLDAFHTFQIPNAAVYALDDDGTVTER